MRMPASVNHVPYDPDTRIPGWTYPDSCEDGLPCALASLIASYAGGDARSCIGWCRNIAGRLWLGAMIDYRYSEAVCIENLHEVVSRAAGALVLTGTGYADFIPDPPAPDALAESGYHKAILELVKSMEPRGVPDMYRRVDMGGIVAADGAKDWETVRRAALSLRYLWLARLHERNRRWSPDDDIETSVDWARLALTEIHEDEKPDGYVPALHAIIGEAFQDCYSSTVW